MHGGISKKSNEVDGRTVDEESDETIESAAAPNNMVSAAVTENEVFADDLPQADQTDDESAEEYDLDRESSEEAEFTEESSDVDDLDDDDEEEGEEDMLNVDRVVDEKSDETKMLEIGEETKEVEESDSLIEEEDDFSGDLPLEFDDLGKFSDAETKSGSSPEQLKMLETGEETKEVEESDSLTEEEDDFSGDLPSEFDDLGKFSDAETESDSSPMVLEGIDAVVAVSSAVKTVESVIIEEIEVSSEGGKITITEEQKEERPKEKKQQKVGNEMSLRKLKSAYKESLIAAKEGKKLTISTDEGKQDGVRGAGQQSRILSDRPMS